MDSNSSRELGSSLNWRKLQSLISFSLFICSCGEECMSGYTTGKQKSMRSYEGQNPHR
jgi:hypothetical protein